MSRSDEQHPTENPTAERLTKEREAEIRRVVDKMGFHPTPALVRALLAEIDALRAAPPTTYLHADGTEEPIGELVARLTRERDRARAYAEERNDEANRVQRSLNAAAAERDEARADLAETRAQLARLREAAADFERDLSRFCDGPARDALRAAISEAGPTLAEIRRAASDFREIRPSVDGDLDAAVDRAQAEGRVLDFPALVRLCMDPQVDTLIYAITEAGAVFLFGETCVRKEVAEIRRAAQVEVLRDAAKEAARGEDFDDIDAPLRGDTLPGCVADWLRQRADDLEAGRE